MKAGDANSWMFGLNPAVRYFVMDGLGVGAFLGFNKIKDGPTTVRFVPQAEYNFNLGSRLFPYAGLGFGFQYFSVEEGGVSASSTDALVQFGGGVKMTFGGGSSASASTSPSSSPTRP